MSKKHYDEVSVIRAISRKQSIAVDSQIKVIQVIKDAADVGIGTWGKIDYLCSIHNYRYIFVTNLFGRKNIKRSSDDELKVGSNKTTKREAKLNMAKMTKDAMKRVSHK